MLQAHKCFSATVKKYLWPVVLAAAIAPALLSVGNAGAASKNDRAVRLLATIPVPVTTDNTTAGGLYSFDISWVD
jgi:hypothetical protein